MAAEAARRYELVVARYILGPWAPSLIEAGHLTKGDRVLDLACGTGVVTRIAASRVGSTGRVIGMDLNPAMIDVARALPAPAGATIEWMEGNALAIPLPDRTLDAVLSQQGLQFFPDRPLALTQMRRLLDHGGRLALSVWSSTGHYNRAVGKALSRISGDDTAARFLASRNAPGRDELERLMDASGFSDVRLSIARLEIHLPALDRFVLEHLSATPVAPAIAALDARSRDHLGSSVVRELEHFADGDGVTYPEETFLVTARVP